MQRKGNATFPWRVTTGTLLALGVGKSQCWDLLVLPCAPGQAQALAPSSARSKAHLYRVPKQAAQQCCERLGTELDGGG